MSDHTPEVLLDAVVSTPKPSASLQYREIALLGVEARRKKRLERAKVAAQTVDTLVATAANGSTESPTAEPKNYRLKQLEQVRAQIDLLNRRMAEELGAKTLDPQTIERLSRSIGLLSERERILDGRPLPGSHRPGGANPRRTAAQPLPQPTDD